MPKKAKPARAFELRRLKEPGMYAVGGVDGLYLNVRNELAKSWILKLWADGKRRELGLGSYPEVSLEQAREKAAELRKGGGKAPAPAPASAPAAKPSEAAPKASAAPEENKGESFEKTARACFAMKRTEFKNPKHAAQWISTLEQYAFPKLGEKYIPDLRRADIVEVLQPIWERITDTATKVRQRIEAVITYGNATCEREGAVNPASWEQLKPLLPSARKLIRRKKKHFPAMPWRRMGEFMPLLQAEQTISARCLEFLILTAARTNEALGARPEHIDREEKVWHIPGNQMKGGLPHRVPLTDAAIRCLDATPRMAGSELIFAGVKQGKTLSENTLLKLTKRLVARMEGKPEATPHGFRSAFKDWHRNEPGFEDEVSELALAHVNSDETRAAYARDELMPKRGVLMQQWARFIFTKPAKVVVPISAKKKARGEAA